MPATVHLFVFSVLIGCAIAISPADEIILPSFNKSFYIQNETYMFVLVPQYHVPLSLTRYVIYTSSTENMQGLLKRALRQNKKRSVQIAPEDIDFLESYLGDTLPPNVVANSQKRAQTFGDGFRSIEISQDAHILTNMYSVSRKRQSGVQLGTTLCLHIPFFTGCDNGGDVTAVKATLTATINAFDTQLDSYTSTNNARANEMAGVLNTQRQLIQQIAAATGNTSAFLYSVSSVEAANTAQQAHGDMIAHAQINYLQRTTNALLRFANALASTDPRAVVAQPSLTQLFLGYKALLSFLVANGSIPIVDSRTFEWVANPLPVNVVSNIVTITQPILPMSTQITQLLGLNVISTMFCSSVPTGSAGCPSPLAGTVAMGINNAGPDQWILGALHAQHTGVYAVQFPSGNLSQTAYNTILSSVGKPTIQGSTVPSQLYCVQFMGFTSLATFNVTPNLLNGIPTPTASPISDCNAYLLTNLNTDLTWFLFALTEGIVVPFYSNCNVSTLLADVNNTANLSIGYLANYPTLGNSVTSAQLSQSSGSFFSYYHVYQEHMISPNCYMNIDPEWIGLEYYINATPTIVSDIPRGFSLSQFTINPAGELSSSLELMYTNAWSTVYQIQLISQNVIVVDQVTALDGSLVLFNITGTSVVDASDNFYGVSNNGRNCIEQSDTYEYDLTSCFFQNNDKLYAANPYLSGSVQTTGIARYTDMFSFEVNFGDTGNPAFPANYYFTLVPLAESDFTYSVNYAGALIPSVIFSTGNVTGCFYQFYFTGTNAFFGPSTSFSQASPLLFNNSVSAVVQVRLGTTYYVFVNGQQSFNLQCTFTNNPATAVSYVPLYSTTKTIISAADLALSASVEQTVGNSTQSTLNQLASIQTSVLASQQNMTQVQKSLGTLNFNVTQLVPYDNFTALRAQVLQMVNNIQPSGSSACAGTGVFGAASCWFQEALNTIIVVGIVAGVAVGLYCLCCKFGLWGKIFSKDGEL